MSTFTASIYAKELTDVLGIGVTLDNYGAVTVVNGPTIRRSAIDPNGVVTANAGSLALQINGTLWVNTTSGTVWVAAGGTAATNFLDNVIETFGTAAPLQVQQVYVSAFNRFDLRGVAVAQAGAQTGTAIRVTTGLNTSSVFANDSGAVEILSGSTDTTGVQAGNSGAMSVLTGDALSNVGVLSGNSGTFTAGTGASTDGASGAVFVRSGTGGTTTGQLQILSGNAAANSGQVSVISGASATGITGNVSVISGVAAGVGAVTSGNVSLTTGTVGGTGTTGTIVLLTGAPVGIGISGNISGNTGNVPLAGTSGSVVFTSGNAGVGGVSGNITTTTGGVAGAGGSGANLTTTGTTGIGTTGSITVATGAATGAGATGSLSLATGSAVVGAATGNILIFSGLNTVAGGTGAVQIGSGQTGAGGITGTVAITSGPSTGAGTSGNITLIPGTTVGGTRGTVVALGLRTTSSTAGAIVAGVTLVPADSGGVFTVATNVAIVLPTPAVGMRLIFCLPAAIGTLSTITTAGGTTYIGTIVIDAATIVATGTVLTFVALPSAIGDNIECIGISATQWLVRAFASAAGGITIA